MIQLTNCWIGAKQSLTHSLAHDFDKVLFYDSCVFDPPLYNQRAHLPRGLYCDNDCDTRWDNDRFGVIDGACLTQSYHLGNTGISIICK